MILLDRLFRGSSGEELVVVLGDIQAPARERREIGEVDGRVFVVHRWFSKGYKCPKRPRPSLTAVLWADDPWVDPNRGLSVDVLVPLLVLPVFL